MDKTIEEGDSMIKIIEVTVNFRGMQNIEVIEVTLEMTTLVEIEVGLEKDIY